MSNTKILRKLECLKLICKTTPLDAILDQLIDSGVFNKNKIEQHMRNLRPVEKEDALLILLENESKDGNISLLYYEFSILPELSAKISILTPAGMREYSYVE